MSYNAGQPPTPVSESTAIEIRRKEGSARSYVAGNGTINAGEIVKLNASGLIEVVGTEQSNDIVGVALYTAYSGARCTVIKGQVRARWDGAGTGTVGACIMGSTTYSGMFTMGVATSGTFNCGIYAPLPGGVALAAANSGQLVPVEIW